MWARKALRLLALGFFGVLGAAIVTILFFNSVIFKFSILPFDKYALSNHKGETCGERIFYLEPFSFVQMKLYVGGYANSSDPSGYEYSILVKGRRINVYRIQEGYAIAEETNGRLIYGWTSNRFPVDGFKKLCNSTASKGVRTGWHKTYQWRMSAKTKGFTNHVLPSLRPIPHPFSN